GKVHEGARVALLVSETTEQGDGPCEVLGSGGGIPDLRSRVAAQAGGAGLAGAVAEVLVEDLGLIERRDRAGEVVALVMGVSHQRQGSGLPRQVTVPDRVVQGGLVVREGLIPVLTPGVLRSGQRRRDLVGRNTAAGQDRFLRRRIK